MGIVLKFLQYSSLYSGSDSFTGLPYIRIYIYICVSYNTYIHIYIDIMYYFEQSMPLQGCNQGLLLLKRARWRTLLAEGRVPAWKARCP